jgi:hypothetical protein
MSDLIRQPKDFGAAVAKMLEGEKLLPLYWYLAGFINKKTGQFVGAAIVQADSDLHAVTPASNLHYRVRGSENDDKVGDILRVKDEHLPAEADRNRFLNPDEVRAIFGQHDAQSEVLKEGKGTQ